MKKNKSYDDKVLKRTKIANKVCKNARLPGSLTRLGSSQETRGGMFGCEVEIRLKFMFKTNFNAVKRCV